MEISSETLDAILERMKATLHIGRDWRHKMKNTENADNTDMLEALKI